MKLAEALVLKSDLHKSIDDLESRIDTHSVVQQGIVPAEDPKELFKELNMKLYRHEKLVVNINASNLAIKTESGMTLSDAISKRDTLSREHGIMKTLVSISSIPITRYSKTEILNVNTLDVPTLQKRVDELAEQKHLIDVEIQAANQNNDLIENYK